MDNFVIDVVKKLTYSKDIIVFWQGNEGGIIALFCNIISDAGKRIIGNGEKAPVGFSII